MVPHYNLNLCLLLPQIPCSLLHQWSHIFLDSFISYAPATSPSFAHGIHTKEKHFCFMLLLPVQHPRGLEWQWPRWAQSLPLWKVHCGQGHRQAKRQAVLRATADVQCPWGRTCNPSAVMGPRRHAQEGAPWRVKRKDAEPMVGLQPSPTAALGVGPWAKCRMPRASVSSPRKWSEVQRLFHTVAVRGTRMDTRGKLQSEPGT